MQFQPMPNKQDLLGFVFFFYLMMAAVFMIYAQEGYSDESRFVGWFLFVLTTAPALAYYINNKHYVPILELVLLNYALSFSLPVLYQNSHAILIETLRPETVPVTETLVYCVLAVVSLYIGYKSASKIYTNFHIPRINLRSNEDKLFIFAVVMQLIYLLNLVKVSPVFANVAHVAISPLLNTAILALLYYKGVLSNKAKLMALVLLGILVMKGVISSMTEAILAPLLVWFICRWMVIKKVPLLFIFVAVILFILLQPVKLEYRNLVWHQGITMNQVDRFNLYVDLFKKQWLTASSDDREIVESTQSRTSLLLATAHIVDWTPSVVPYRNGETLSYMFVAWVPRFLWPEKPTAQEANIHYAIDYGITSKKGTETAMFGAGHLGEVYMNFGLLGVMPVYFILGLLYFLPLYLLFPRKNSFDMSLGKEVNVPMVALIITSTMNLIFIGSTIANTFGGMIQQLLAQALLIHFLCNASKRVVR